MKSDRPSAFNGAFSLAGRSVNLRNFGGKPVGFVLLAFVIGATISQGSFAFADDSTANPFRAIWEAIGELQVKTDSLQAQIDDLKSQQGSSAAATQAVSRTSDGSIMIEVGSGGSGQTVLTLAARNAGPDNSVGTKLTVFYQRSVLQVNFVEGADCTDGSRGIIECYLGTLEAGSQRIVTIDATPLSLGQQAIITAEFSSITRDSNPSDNRAEAVFITAIAPVAQPAPVPTVPSGGGAVPAGQEPSGQEGQQIEQPPGSENEQDVSEEEADDIAPEETTGESVTEGEGEDTGSGSEGEAGSSEDATGGSDQSNGADSGDVSGNESNGEASGPEDATGDDGQASEATGGEDSSADESSGNDSSSESGSGDSSGSSGDSDGGTSGDDAGGSGDSGSDAGSGADSGSSG